MSQSDRPKPFQPRGAVDGCVADSNMIENMSFLARYGSSCGSAFNAKEFCKLNIQWAYQLPYLLDRPSQSWTLCRLPSKPHKTMKKHKTSSLRTRKK